MNKEQVKGNLKKVAGSVKEMTGKVFHDKDLEDKGRQEKALGDVESDYGKQRQNDKK
jgi:uncharacterized protein YjbJ (UPF0337 family)